jgi:hypothetical protein
MPGPHLTQSSAAGAEAARHAGAAGGGGAVPGWVRLGLAAGALALAVLVVADFAAERGRRRRTLARLASGPAAALPLTVQPQVAGEPDPVRAELRLARALVAVELDPVERVRIATGDEATDAESRRHRLELAAELARDALAERPAAWQAPMLLGAATYLAWSEARDPRLFTQAAAWDRPLTLARSLAPGNDEPDRFVVTAYLELWAALSPEKRKTARRLLESAFRDELTFARLVGHWLTVAGSRDEAFGAIPPEPFAWRYLESVYAQRRDWEGYQLAHERFEAALHGDLEAKLAEAGARRAGGDLGGARALYLEAVAQAPPAERYLPVLRTALAQAPPGPTSAGQAAPFSTWLDWTLDLCLIDRCPLPRPLMARLTGLAGDGLPDHRAAFAALAGDRLPDAEVLERRSARLWHEDWGPYLIAKARELTRRGQVADAEAALAHVHRSWQQHPSYWLARRDLAAAKGRAADDAEAKRRLADLARRRWPAYAWTWNGPRARLDLLAAGAADGLMIDVAEAPADGAAVAVQVDGAESGILVARPGTVLRLDRPIDPGLHQIDLAAVAGGPVRPGAVILTGREGS